MLINLLSVTGKNVAEANVSPFAAPGNLLRKQNLPPQPMFPRLRAEETVFPQLRYLICRRLKVSSDVKVGAKRKGTLRDAY